MAKLQSGTRIYGTATIDTSLTLNGTTNSVSTATGSLTIPYGGLGVGGNINAGSYVTVLDGFYSINTFTGSYSDGIIVDYYPNVGATGSGRISVGPNDILVLYSGGPNATPMATFTTGTSSIASISSATSTTTGALTVAGGVGIGGSLWVNNNILPGTTSSTLGTLANPFKGLYVTSSTINVGNVPLSSDNVINLITPGLYINSSTQASSTTTGALQVLGGAGIVQNLWVGGTANLGANQTNYVQITGASTGVAAQITSAGGDSSVALSITTKNYAPIYIGQPSTSTSQQVFIGPGGGISLVVTGNVNSVNYSRFNGASSGNNPSWIARGGDNAVGLDFATWNTATINFYAGGDYNAGQGLKQLTISQTGLTIYTGTNSISTTTGALVVQGGVGVAGNLFVGGVITATSGLYAASSNSILTVGTNLGTYPLTFTASGSSGIIAQFLGNSDASIAAGAGLYTTRMGANSTNGYISVLQNQPLILQTNNTTRAQIDATGVVTVYSTASSTSTTTGALIVSGGIGLGGSLNVGGSIFVSSTATISNTTNSSSTTTGALTVTGGVGVGGNLNIGGTTYHAGNVGIGVTSQNIPLVVSGASNTDGSITSQFQIWSTGTYTNFPTAGIEFSNQYQQGTNAGMGGISVSKLNTTSGDFSAYLSLHSRNNGSGVTEQVRVTNTGSMILFANNNAVSTTSGVLQMQGGAGIGGNVWIGGSLNVAGGINATISGSITTATNLAGGTAGQIPYQTAPGATNFFGPGTAGNVLVSGGTGTPVYQNTLTLTGTTAAASSTTGALTVAGGAGIGGALYVGGGLTVYGAITATSLTIQYTTITQTIVTSPDVFTITNTTQSLSSTTGALVVAGGVGVGGNLYVGNTTAILSPTASLSTSSGALTVQGGVGVADSIYAGNRVGWGSTTGTSVAYQVYNSAVGSIDLYFG